MSGQTLLYDRLGCENSSLVSATGTVQSRTALHAAVQSACSGVAQSRCRLSTHQHWTATTNYCWITHTHTHTRLTALFPGLPSWAGTRKVKPCWILLKQETVGGNGISWAICKSAPRCRQITTPAHTTQFFTRRMPFLPPNQQRQSTEGTLTYLDISFQSPSPKGFQVHRTSSVSLRASWNTQPLLYAGLAPHSVVIPEPAPQS